MKTISAILAASAMAVLAVPVDAQTSTRDRLGQLLGTLFGTTTTSANSSIEAQWAAGQMPLAAQRTQFNAQVDSAISARTVTYATGNRMKADYGSLVDLEARYGADRRFTTAERSDLTQRYNTLAGVVQAGTYADGLTGATAVADGQTEFGQRVDRQVSARRLSRTAGTRLKTDYAAVVQVETGYLADGMISDTERADLDARLDALDMRVGDVQFTPAVQLTPQQRLDAVLTALPGSGLTASAQAQLRVEQGDLSRLAAAYGRYTASSEERAYLETRLADLETRARVRR